MSSDRMTEILRYLTAISHDVGGLRGEVKELRKEVGELRAGQDELRKEVGELRTEVRTLTTPFMRLEAVVLETRADTRELEDRVAALESKGQ